MSGSPATCRPIGRADRPMKSLPRVAIPRPRSFILIVTLFTAASSLDAQDSIRGSARDVHMRIQTDRSSYRVGDSIRVRLTLRNLSANTVKYEGANYVSLATLKVSRDGREIQPTGRG